ncbi:MAG: alpha/beta fold hydrolase [Bacteroidales bacterium]|nr:alpha/beta fold hydrolase [Bacteroidales bacterium]
MPEQAINIGEKDERISCILHTPSIEKEEKTVIVFMHGWAGYRIGPHQMFVKYARQFSEMGYYSIRFDFRGRGYSAGRRFETSNTTMLFDLEQVISYLNANIKYHKIILFGICSGAKLAIYYAKAGKQKIDGVIEMSSSLLRVDSVAQTQINKKKNSILNYLNKEKLIKLTTGEVKFRKLIEVPFRYVSFLSHSIVDRFKPNKSAPAPQKKVITTDSSFKNYSGTPFLLIHGEKDPETDVTLQQITSLLEKYGIGYHKHIIMGANHSFYSVEWEMEIFNIIRNWMIKNYSLEFEAKEVLTSI